MTDDRWDDPSMAGDAVIAALADAAVAADAALADAEETADAVVVESEPCLAYGQSQHG